MGIPSKIVAAPLRLYRLVVSPLYGQRCRYYPSCSAYALRAIEELGVTRGLWLALRRLGRCHPWCDGGVDLVPTPAAYRWWGRAEGTDGEDDPVDDVIAGTESESRLVRSSSMAHLPTQSRDLLGA